MEHFLTYLRESAKRKFDEPAISDFKGVQFTHKDLFGRIKRFQMAFSDIGLEAGERVAICGKNSARWGSAFLSTVTYKAVAVPLLNGFTPEDIQNLLSHSQSSVLFTEKRILLQIHPEALENLKAVFSLEDDSVLYLKDPSKAALLDALPERMNEAYPDGFTKEMVDYEGTGLDELCLINYTSGTTGNPKGVMLSTRNIVSNLDFDLNEFKVHDDDSVVVMLPLAHMYGLTIEFLYTLCGGANVVFLGRTPTPTLLLEAMRTVRPYIIITVPMVIEKIVKGKILPALNKPVVRILKHVPILSDMIYKKVHDEFMGAFGGKVRYISIGGAALSPAVEKILLKARIPFSVGYGMTECAPLVAYVPAGKFKSGSCGRPILRMQVRVDSPDPEKIPGELQIHGDNVMIGYYRNEDATRQAFTQDGWLRSGDLGVMDKDGNIYIRGRSKCMILTSSGQNIYPEEIEDKLNGIEGVVESLVVSRGQRLVALVDVTESIKNDEESLSMAKDRILREINRQMPSYSKISEIEVLFQGFVHTPKNSIKRNLYS